MEESVNVVQRVVLTVSILAILLGIFIAIRLSRSLTVQVKHSVHLLGEISIGNFYVRVHVISRDEIGSMAVRLNTMLDNITALIQSQGTLDVIQESIIELREDMTGSVADSFNSKSDHLSVIIRKS